MGDEKHKVQLRHGALQPEKVLSDYVGKNDKTKVVAKLQKKGAGAPGREPVVSEEEQKAMVACARRARDPTRGRRRSRSPALSLTSLGSVSRAVYHKKEQEFNKMALEDEDSYQNSAWANPKALKNAFTGVGDISWRARG